MTTKNKILRLPEVFNKVPIAEFSQTFDYWQNSSFDKQSLRD